MSVKIHTLAKELDMSSKDLLEKVNQMGIEASSHLSSIEEGEAVKVKKFIKGIEHIEGTDTSKTNKRVSPKKVPVGKPIINEETFNRSKAPSGKPIVPDDFDNKPQKDEPPVAKEVKPEAKPEVKPEEKVEVKEKTKPKEKEYTNAPNKPMRFKKVFDSTKQPKPEEKKPESRTNKKPENKDSRSKDYKNSKPSDKTGKDYKSSKPGDKTGKDYNSSKPGDKTDKDYKSNKPGDKPVKNYRDNKPGYKKDKDDNKDRKPETRKSRSESTSTNTIEVKPSKKQNKNEHVKSKDKDRNKFAKLEKGAQKNKNYFAGRSLEKQVKNKRRGKPKNIEPEVQPIEETIPEGTIILTVPITVAGFCEQTELSTSTVIMSLMKQGIMATINQNLDEDIVKILAEDLGADIVIGNVQETKEEEGIEAFEDEEANLVSRPPIITVMGHVDHGKTSLLDAIRKTNVTQSESGGITQHIGASEVTINDQRIVFLDTPGHEAFTAMRARGAHVTDIAVLVVAADDSVKPQTIESISHAKAAGVPIIVAINKMDKPGANPDKVKQDLTEHGILVEEWGGDVIAVPVSAKSGEGIVSLLEMVLLQAEVLELKANPDRLALGTVVESRLDKSKGPIATLLVTNGTINSGDSLVAGVCSGKIRLMNNYKGKKINKAGPSTAVEILGLTDVPLAGDEFNVTKDDKTAREIAENRKSKQREEVLARNSSTTLEKLFTQIQEGEVKELNLIVKGDVQGSVGAIVSSLEKLPNEKVKLNIIHTGVGTITESDIMLASTSNAIVIGFNVRPTTAVVNRADKDDVEIRTYRVIYDIIDDVENAMKGMLDPEYKEEVLGKVEIRETFKVPNIGIIGGAYVTEGKVLRNAEVRLVRDGIVIHEGKISSLKRFKDDVKEVHQNYECGIGIENYNDIKTGDIIECFHMVEIKK